MFIYFMYRRRKWHLTPVLLPGKSHGRRSLVACSPWGRRGSDTTERLYFHFSLSCIGEGNGNPLLCSCLENPRNRGAWRAAVYGVAQSWTRLKQLSSSSSSSVYMLIPNFPFISPAPLLYPLVNISMYFNTCKITLTFHTVGRASLQIQSKLVVHPVLLSCPSHTGSNLCLSNLHSVSFLRYVCVLSHFSHV